MKYLKCGVFFQYFQKCYLKVIHLIICEKLENEIMYKIVEFLSYLCVMESRSFCCRSGKDCRSCTGGIGCNCRGPSGVDTFPCPLDTLDPRYYH